MGICCGSGRLCMPAPGLVISNPSEDSAFAAKFAGGHLQFARRIPRTLHNGLARLEAVDSWKPLREMVRFGSAVGCTSAQLLHIIASTTSRGGCDDMRQQHCLVVPRLSIPATPRKKA